jgi:hypothetical protein
LDRGALALARSSTSDLSGEFFVAFMGETVEIGLAELLSVLAHRGHTGRLTIISEGEEAQIFLDGGKVILVSSSNHALRLGRILLRLGILTVDQLDNALREQDVQGGRQPLGQMLIEAGAVTADDLARAAEEQCIEALTRVMVSRHGTFMFNRDVKPLAKQGLVALNTDRIVLEASRRADEMVTLRSLLPNAHARLTVDQQVGNPTGEQFTALERRVLDALHNGAGSLADLGRDVTVEEVSLWRTVVSLRERGSIVAQEGDDPDDERELQELLRERTVDEVIQLCAEGARALTNRVPTLGEVRAGSPAGSQTIAAVTVVVREVIAAFNAGLILRAFASFSDDHFRRRGALPADEIVALRAPSHPLPVEDQETFLAIRDVRVLSDGRISAILLTREPTVGETRKVLIFTQKQRQIQIDAVIEAPSPQAPTVASVLQSADETAPSLPVQTHSAR